MAARARSVAAKTVDAVSARTVVNGLAGNTVRGEKFSPTCTGIARAARSCFTAQRGVAAPRYVSIAAVTALPKRAAAITGFRGRAGVKRAPARGTETCEQSAGPPQPPHAACYHTLSREFQVTLFVSCLIHRRVRCALSQRMALMIDDQTCP